MDALSHILQLAGLQGSLDLRCHFAESFSLDRRSSARHEAPFHLVLAGRARLELRGGESVMLNPGDLVLLPRGGAHVLSTAGTSKKGAGPSRMETDGPLALRRSTDGEADVDLLCGRYTFGAGPAALIMDALPDVLHARLAQTGDMDVLRAVATLLRAEVTGLQPDGLAVVTALSQALFVLALRAYARRNGIQASLLVLLGDPRLSKAVQAMLLHPEKPWDLASLAQQATMSRATFARHFKAKGNLSPWELLTCLRMHTACNLLKLGALAIGDIAERVGYQSDSAFGKAFARHTGLTPATFRRQQRLV